MNFETKSTKEEWIEAVALIVTVTHLLLCGDVDMFICESDVEKERKSTVGNTTSILNRFLPARQIEKQTLKSNNHSERCETVLFDQKVVIRNYKFL